MLHKKPEFIYRYKQPFIAHRRFNTFPLFRVILFIMAAVTLTAAAVMALR